MAAECYACTLGLTRMPAALSDETDPVGACWECHVFGCHGHAAFDQGSGKFLCVITISNALAVSSGLDDMAVSTRFSDSQDFERRFAALAKAVSELLIYWRSGGGEQALGDALSDFQLRERADWDLASYALAVAAFLVGHPASSGVWQEARPINPATEQLFGDHLTAILLRDAGGMTPL